MNTQEIVHPHNGSDEAKNPRLNNRPSLPDLFARIMAWFTPRQPSLFERAQAELNRREIEARRQHKAVKHIQQLRRRAVSDALAGRLK